MMTEPVLELTSDLARVRGLYKLLPMKTPIYVLESVMPGETSVIFAEQDVPEALLVSAQVEKLGYSAVKCAHVQCDSLENFFGASMRPESHQLVIMHGGFSKLKAKLGQVYGHASDTDIFNALTKRLASGGIIAGCFRNRAALSRKMRFFRKESSIPCLSYLSLKKLLNSSGFSEPRMFLVYPGRNSPIKVAEVNNAPSLLYSKNQIEFLKNWLSKPNYFMKLVFSLLGIGLWFEDEYFFYAYKS